MPFGPIQVLDEFFEKWAIPAKFNMNYKKINRELFNRSEYAID